MVRLFIDSAAANISISLCPFDKMRYFCSQITKDNMPEYDIAKELAKLHSLSGAAYSKQVERIARKGLFHPVEGEHNIYSAIGDNSNDYESLLNAARKAVSHGYKVYILPNPNGTKTPDFIFERKGVFRIFELKTIQGVSSVSNRLSDSGSQSNHVLLNLTTRYNGGLLAVQIREYFEQNSHAIEVLIFKGKSVISIKRSFIIQNDFIRKFRREYGK